MHLLTRRATLETLALSVLAELELGKAAHADEKFVTIGMDFSLTGSDADSSARARDGALMAIDDANANGGPGGYKLRVLVLDDGTATAGQYDPAQAAINARKMVADPTIVAAVGPQSSTPGKAMSAILSLGNLATITPSSTNPDITDPKFAQLYRPKGLPIYFRMVTTDAYQGPNMANFFADVLKVKSIYGLDDSGAFGVGVSAAFEDQARKRGIKVLGHDRLDPKAADYSAVITKIRSLGPEGLYYGGDSQAGIKVAKQSYEALPNVIKAGADGTFGPSMLEGAGFPAIEGWYATIPAPTRWRRRWPSLGCSGSSKGPATIPWTIRSLAMTRSWSLLMQLNEWPSLASRSRASPFEMPFRPPSSIRCRARSPLTSTVISTSGRSAFFRSGMIQSTRLATYSISTSILVSLWCGAPSYFAAQN